MIQKDLMRSLGIYHDYILLFWKVAHLMFSGWLDLHHPKAKKDVYPWDVTKRVRDFTSDPLRKWIGETFEKDLRDIWKRFERHLKKIWKTFVKDLKSIQSREGFLGYIIELEIYFNFVIKSYQSMDLIPNPPILGSGPR